MNFLKRAWWSVTRRKWRTALQALMFFTVANLVLAGLIIQASAEKASDFARMKLGAVVTFAPDMDQVLSRLLGGAGLGSGSQQLRIDSITREMAEELSGLPHVATYNTRRGVNAYSDGFTPVTNGGAAAGGQNNLRIMSQGLGDDRPMPDISVEGALNTELLPMFQDGDARLLEGRFPDAADAEKPVAIIERRLAEANGMKLGDTLTLKSLADNRVEFAIIGIYEVMEAFDMTSPLGGIPLLLPYNKIYTPIPYANALTTTSNNAAPNMEAIDTAYFFIDDPLNIDAFKAAAAQTSIDWERYRLDAKDAAYRQMVGPISNIASLSGNIVALVSIAGIAILALLLLLFFKERVFEMGVLLSLGERKTRLVGQLFAETAAIALLAFTLSGFSGHAIAQQLGNQLLQRELQAAQEQQAQASRGPQTVRVMIGGSDAGIGGSAPGAEPVHELDLAVTGAELVKLGAIGLIIVLLGTLVPTANVIRFHPKTILTRNG